jgi:hypothetical protein
VFAWHECAVTGLLCRKGPARHPAAGKRAPWAGGYGRDVAPHQPAERKCARRTQPGDAGQAAHGPCCPHGQIPNLNPPARPLDLLHQPQGVQSVHIQGGRQDEKELQVAQVQGRERESPARRQ